MPKFGAHMSIAGGLEKAFDRGLSVGCDAIQIFTKSSNQWRARPLSEAQIEAFRRRQAETGMPVVAHSAYLINIGTPKPDLWEKSLEALQVELERCEALGIPYLVLHPGSHTGSGEEAGIAQVARALSELHRRTPGFRSRIALEVTAGQGSNLGYRFEHLARIIEATEEGEERLVVCFDTCHAFAAGYDLSTPEGYEATFEAFDRVLGLERLVVFHLNDSLHPLGSRKDRHAHIGQGKIGLEGFRRLVNDPRFRDHPMLLETPKGPEMKEDVENLRVLRGLLEA